MPVLRSSGERPTCTHSPRRARTGRTVLGERGVPGRGPNNLNRPTDIAWLPDGTFFVADGYAGTRVAKFDRTGKFLMDWGRNPVDPANPKPFEFWSVHSIGISRDRRLFVADREHHRMQVFDENGKFLAMWPTGYKSAGLAHFVTQDDFVWVADWTTDRLVKYDLDGHYILDIGGHARCRVSSTASTRSTSIRRETCT
jgi:hypothetical protein